MMFDDTIEARSSFGAARAEMLREQLLPAREILGARLEELVEHKRALQDAGRRAARGWTPRRSPSSPRSASPASFSASCSPEDSPGISGESIAASRTPRHGPAVAAAAREDLLGIVAHDLRNPLGAITLNAALIDRGTTEPKVRRHAESIAAIATRTEAFIQKLLDAASIEAGRLSLSWKRCVVGDVLAMTIETFGALAAEKAVTLDQEIGRGDLGFWGDPERIGQVLSNLVGNALKFTPEGGRITIRAVESGFHTRIEVRDTGPGIASQHLPRIFDRFWKADAGGRKGTGLGLYIAKGIVEGHRGRIWVESRVGVGSAFIFELPIAPPSGAEAMSPADGPEDQSSTDLGQEPGAEVAEHPRS